MINLILKDLVLWLFGLFLDLMNYCADALLGLMNTDLAYFESNVPIIVKLYGVFVCNRLGIFNRQLCLSVPESYVCRTRF